MIDSTRALQALLQADALSTSLFPPNSRYHGVDTARTTTADGRIISYLRRRFVPRPEDLSVLHEHTVVQGERLDTLAARYLGDPELYWRLCDASGAMRPDELTDRAGTRVSIALPHGVAGGSNA